MKFHRTKLTKYRKKRGMSREELAEKIGVSTELVTNWEDGKKTPHFEHILKIAQILLCGVTEISSPEKEDAPLNLHIEETIESMYALPVDKQKEIAEAVKELRFLHEKIEGMFKEC